MGRLCCVEGEKNEEQIVYNCYFVLYPLSEFIRTTKFWKFLLPTSGEEDTKENFLY
jgi:hypothetical protein